MHSRMDAPLAPAFSDCRGSSSIGLPRDPPTCTGTAGPHYPLPRHTRVWVDGYGSGNYLNFDTDFCGRSEQPDPGAPREGMLWQQQHTCCGA